jgi:hypothetical protein
LLIDEIYINKTLTFKSHSIVGCAENNPHELAKTVQSVMISSSYGNFKDIIKLVSLSHKNREELTKLTLNVIDFLYRSQYLKIYQFFLVMTHVHIFKNVKSIIRRAPFQHLRQLHANETNSLWKNV